MRPEVLTLLSNLPFPPRPTTSRNDGALAAIAQTSGDAVDRQVEGAFHPLVLVAGAQPAYEFNLQVIQRVEVGKAVADRPGEQRIALQ